MYMRFAGGELCSLKYTGSVTGSLLKGPVPSMRFNSVQISFAISGFPDVHEFFGNRLKESFMFLMFLFCRLNMAGV